jgi:hypothetical protein
LGHRTPLQAMRAWRQKRPDLFVRRTNNQAGLDSYLLTKIICQIRVSVSSHYKRRLETSKDSMGAEQENVVGAWLTIKANHALPAT